MLNGSLLFITSKDGLIKICCHYMHTVKVIQVLLESYIMELYISYNWHVVCNINMYVIYLKK